jgi:8-oxo-dGTP pyrophosphatase MutT (NUDIX family)
VNARSPRRAATVLLLRERAGRLEVLMLRRHLDLRVLGGAWVFPGGVVDDADGDDAVLSRIPAGVRARCRSRLAQPPLPPPGEREAAAIHVAACRETLEEAGVLLARTRDGAPPDARDVEEARRSRHDFLGATERLDLVPDVERLVFWSHWITPSVVAARFDTRFFVTAMPARQTAEPDAAEMTEAVWVEPAGVLPDAPAPTRMTLADVADAHCRHGSLAALLAAEAERPVPPIMPRVEDPGASHAIYPWDAGYAAAAGEGIELEDVPPHLARLPSRGARVPSR